MKTGKFWLAVLAGGVVANILDGLVFGVFFSSAMANMEIMRHNVNPAWYVVGDFIAVFVMMWFYARVHGSFTEGSKGGATFGLYAGIFASFPLWLFIHLMINGFPYGWSWIFTCYGILWGVIVGATLGSVYKKPVAA